MIAPQAPGNAAANKPIPRNSQNSLASRHGPSSDIMRARSSGGANSVRQPTPISNPPRTVPATIMANNRPMSARGIQNEGSWALTPSTEASDAIMNAPGDAPRAPHRSAPYTPGAGKSPTAARSEEHTSELQP